VALTRSRRSVKRRWEGEVAIQKIVSWTSQKTEEIVYKRSAGTEGANRISKALEVPERSACLISVQLKFISYWHRHSSSLLHSCCSYSADTEPI